MIGFGSNPLHYRKTSGFSLSLATGLAMETLFRPRQEVFDPDRVVPKRPTRTYTVFAINVHTLIRNIVNACDQEHWKGLNSAQVGEVLQQEMEVIQSLCSNEGQGAIVPWFYTSDYDTLFVGLSPLFKLREDTTPTTRMLRMLSNHTVEDLRDQKAQIVTIQDFERQCRSAAIVMMTHRPLDLLIHQNVGWLSLLESHTGKIKESHEWNSKYHRYTDARFDRLPFCRVLLYIFGDSSTIVPISIKYRRKILDESEKDRWNPSTSDYRIMKVLNSVFDGDNAILQDIRAINQIRHF